MPDASPMPIFDGHNDVLLRLIRKGAADVERHFIDGDGEGHLDLPRMTAGGFAGGLFAVFVPRSEEHTSELQSLMRISYAVFCLKKKTYTTRRQYTVRIS